MKTLSKPLYEQEVQPDEPIGSFVRCCRGIRWSTAGGCREGAILRKSDPRVGLAPECFRPLAEIIEVPRKD